MLRHRDPAEWHSPWLHPSVWTQCLVGVHHLLYQNPCILSFLCVAFKMGKSQMAFLTKPSWFSYEEIYSGRKGSMGSLSKNILIQPLTKQLLEFLAAKY